MSAETASNVSQFPGRAKQGRPEDEKPKAGDRVIGEMPEPPGMLGYSGRRQWAKLCDALILRYQLTEPVLAAVLSYSIAVDELVSATRAVQKDGAYLKDGNDKLYAHPALKRRDKAQQEIRLHARLLNLIPATVHGTPDTGDMFSDYE